MHLIHTLFPKLCRNRLVWRGNTLCCGSCGSVAGYRYRIGDDLRIYLFPQYEDMKQAVLAMPDTKRVCAFDDIVGEVSFLDFVDAFAEMLDEYNGLNAAADPDDVSTEDILALTDEEDNTLSDSGFYSVDEVDAAFARIAAAMNRIDKPIITEEENA